MAFEPPLTTAELVDAINGCQQRLRRAPSAARLCSA